MDSFDHFFKTPEINMLNAALPYVSDHMGKSLALYIKSTEMQRILSDFDKEELLSSCGYESGTPDPEAMLKAMGAHVTATEDGMIIEGGYPLHGASVFCKYDHRIAMTFAIAGINADGETDIIDSECVDVSYPSFFEDLKLLSK